VRFNDTITILSKETEVENNWDFFSKDTSNIDTSNIVLVRLTGEDDLIGDTTTINSLVIIGLILNETEVLP